MLSLAISIASALHGDDKDKGGQPIIMHCVRVMNNVDGNDLKQIAIMHDVIEDHINAFIVGCGNRQAISDLDSKSRCVYDIAHSTLIELGFDNEIADAILCLTKRPSQSYQEYIEQVTTNQLAIQVKIADIVDNSNIHRLNALTEKDISRLKKYHSSMKVLKAALLEKPNYEL